MRSVGSPSYIRLFGASLLTLATASLSAAGCSDDPVRRSGNRNGTSAGNSGTSGSGLGGSDSAGSTGSPGGTGASSGSSAAGTDSGSGGSGLSAGTAGTGTGGDTSGAGSSAASGGDSASAGSGASSSGGSGGTGPCQMANYTFAPKIPTVFLLVDQSGSMFKCQSGGASDATGRACADSADTSWYPLRDAALEVIEALQADVRFGFAPLGGEIEDSCPNPEPVLPDFNNYAAIEARYTALMPPVKGETPVSFALQEVGKLLAADDSPGDRFILFVTDGEPDYCNDGDNLCPADSAIYHLQTLYAAEVQTLILGLPAPGSISANAASILAAFANAGAGQPAVRPGNYDADRLYDECNFKQPWADDLVLTGKPVERGSELATYSPEGGTGTVYRPEATNQQALIDLLGAALSNVKSCTFDLSNVNGQSIKVDLNKLADASVAIEGTTVAQDATNGWSMMSQTQLVLSGTACDSWRSPENDDIAFNFPCNTIIFE